MNRDSNGFFGFMFPETPEDIAPYESWANIDPEESALICLGSDDVVAAVDAYGTAYIRPGRFADPDEAKKRIEAVHAAIHDVYEVHRPMCGWFALCENKSVKTRPHPVLGDVPICKRCDNKIEEMK